MQFKISVLLGGAMTHDKVSVFSEVTSPGSGPPLHSHVAQIEIFHVIKGRHKFVLNEKEMVAVPGDCILIPVGAAHTFQNIDSDEGLLHFELLPSGSSEEFFTRLVADHASIADMPAFFQEHGLELLGPPLS